MLKKSKDIFNKKGFEGDTHEDYRTFGKAKAKEQSDYLGFGTQRTKKGVEYWVLPDYYNPALDFERKSNGDVFSKTLTIEQYNNFGFDEPEPII